MENLDAYGDVLIEGDPTEKHTTSVSVGNDAIRAAFEKANYIPGSITKVAPPEKLVVAAKIKPVIAPPAEVPVVEIRGASAAVIYIDEIQEVTHDHECSACGCAFIMTESDEQWFVDKGWPIPKRCKTCRDNKVAKKQVVEGTDVEEASTEHTCIECTDKFYTTASHEKWYASKNLLVPARCPKCIVKRKADNKAAYAKKK